MEEEVNKIEVSNLNITEALKEQIKYCNELSHYHCGIYLKRFKDKKLVFDEVVDLITNKDSIERMFNNSCSTEIRFKNGSFIRIICANQNARGYKNHGAIIDNEIETEIINCIIMPTIIPRCFEDFKREPWEEAKKRVLYCDI